MKTKARLLLFVTIMLLTLSAAVIVNVALNFRDYSIKSEMQKAHMTAEIVKDGLTSHMVNGNMDQRKYFLDQIASKDDIDALWILRSQNVIKQYGPGFHNEVLRDEIDKQVLKSGKTVKKVIEHADKILLRVTVPYNAEVSDKGADCLSCHEVSIGSTLGAISMEFDITSMRNTGMFTVLKILGINLFFLIIALLLINYYVTPYMRLFENLQTGITKAYSGDFTYEFSTRIGGDGKKIVKQINTLFRKMQDTFGHIKHDLGTFIPQGCVSTSDPLYEAKTIINELSDIYKFKKTIELDATKQVVYSRLISVLESKYKVKHFAIYEVNNHNATRNLVYISEGESICNHEVDAEAGLCRAYRSKTDVISTEFENLCQSCHAGELDYLCIPFGINKENSLIVSITTRSDEELEEMNSVVPSLKNYLEAIKPVLESKILMDTLRDSSLRDGMTGLYNRRFLEEFIDKIMSQAQRAHETYSVLMIDVDFFKKVNDTYGHDVGDVVIVEIGKVLQENIREADLAIRYGGEEFVVMLHNANDEGTLQVASKIHSAFAQRVFDTGTGETIQKTLSIGISKFPKDGDTIWKCIKFADTALYVAKTTGRNKIVEFTKEMSESENLR
jgi:two-component system, cell cycle response regulator